MIEKFYMPFDAIPQPVREWVRSEIEKNERLRPPIAEFSHLEVKWNSERNEWRGVTVYNLIEPQ